MASNKSSKAKSSEAKSSNGGGGYEVLKVLKTGKDTTYTPGDKVTELKKKDAESLLLRGVIGKSGSFKKQEAEKELLEKSGGGNVEDVLELVKDLKNEIQELKVENKKLQETAAKK